MSGHPSRGDAARMGLQAVEILRVGEYQAPSGRTVSVREAAAKAVAGTVDYPPGAPVPPPSARGLATAFEVNNESTLAAAARLAAAGQRPCALNFASAKHPGGGFLSGARAQEESLARAAGLVACLDGRPMYAHHRAQHDPLYTDWMLYSPEVPVFRLDGEALLEQPFACAFLTAPAPNAKHLHGRDAEIRAAFERRIGRLLAIAEGHGHQALVLGAWGCGAFGNDTALVAGLFHDALVGPFAGAFAHVVFAVLDWTSTQHFIGPFRARFGEGQGV